MNILVAILVFSFLIITHEFGHFLAARRAGIGVTEFSVGMGPRIVHFEKGGTIYSLKAIPFGGSCAMVGEDQDSDAEDAFNKKSVWARISVVLAGPMANFFWALVLAVVLMAAAGVNPARVTYVEPGYGAEAAGLQAGDTIKSINGTRMYLGSDFLMYQVENSLDGTPLTVEYERNGQTATAMVDTHFSSYRFGISYMPNDEQASITVSEGSPVAAAGLKTGDIVTALDGQKIASGAELQVFFAERTDLSQPVAFTYLRGGAADTVTVAPELYEGETYGFDAGYARDKATFGSAFKYALYEMRYCIRSVFASLRMLFTGKAGVEDLSGPVGIVSIIGETVKESAKEGFRYVILNLLNIAVLLSANLGVMNLLPIPALDGGRLVFLIIEAVTGKRVPPDKEGIVHVIGFILLMALMAFILFNDIRKLF